MGKVVKDKNNEIRVLLSIIYDKYCFDSGISNPKIEKIGISPQKNKFVPSLDPENVKHLDNRKYPPSDKEMYNSPPESKITTQKLKKVWDKLNTFEEFEKNSSPNKEFKIRVQRIDSIDIDPLPR